MWFRNLYLYRLHVQAEIDAAALEEALAQQTTRPLRGSEARRTGWAPPAGRRHERLLHELQGHRLITAWRQERILPAAVVSEEVEDRAADREAAEGRALPRRERQAIKEQVYEELLPRAFVRTHRIDLWWDTGRRLIGINTSSRQRAEEVLDLLRMTLGSLKVTPLAPQKVPARAMTEWLADPTQRPEGLILGDRVELRAKDEGVVKGREIDLDSDEMRSLLENDRQASQLGVEIEERFSFTLRDDFSLRGIRFSDSLIDEAAAADDGDDAILRLETDFVLMAQTLGTGVDQLLGWLGGEAINEAPLLDNAA
ncbi:recombination-associated protein RdgC [Halomonas salifodinae]|uniref:Recombination-associated protein RdgC n=1 Tax=Halomonas salifodinae TaxID=438745 RepID=A0ABW2EYE7_9GAMM